MSIFELKLKSGNFDVELKGEIDSVLQVYEKLRNDFFTNPVATVENKPLVSGDVTQQPNELERAPNRVKKVTKNNGQKKSNKPQIVDLDVNFDEGKFYERYTMLKPKTSKDSILIVMNLYQEQTNQKVFTYDIVHTLLDKVRVDTPDTLRQQLANFVNKDKLLERTEGGYAIKHAGKQYITSIVDKLEKNIAEQ